MSYSNGAACPRQECLQEVREREEEEEEQCQQVCKEEDEAACLENRKKNKNKYILLVYRKVPSDPTILPAQYATQKLKAGETTANFTISQIEAY